MWNDRQIAVEETNYKANNILHALYFYKVNISKDVKKSPDNLKFEKKIQVQGP
jgi:hypothetical protein